MCDILSITTSSHSSKRRSILASYRMRGDFDDQRRYLPLRIRNTIERTYLLEISHRLIRFLTSTNQKKCQRQCDRRILRQTIMSEDDSARMPTEITKSLFPLAEQRGRESTHEKEREEERQRQSSCTISTLVPGREREQLLLLFSSNEPTNECTDEEHLRVYQNETKD